MRKVISQLKLMPFWKKTSRPTRDDAMKTIAYRGGVVTFRIPASWREEYSDVDGGTFYEDRADSGTLGLRTTLLRAPAKLQVRPDSAMEVLRALLDQLASAGVKVKTNDRKDGNAALRYEDDAIEDGVPLRIFYWVVANPLPPHHVRVANFSFTILARLRHQPDVTRVLEMLKAEIDAATFSSETVVVSA